MIYEKVNFNEEAIKGMSRDEFLRIHKDSLWLDRDESTRIKMLDEVYGIIHPAERTRKKKGN